MNNISMIAAVGKNNELGLKNELIFHLKEDMRFFRETTLNKTVVMGRKTFESLPGLLPKRKSIIITSNKELKVSGAKIMNSVDDVLNYAKDTKEDIFIIGGGKIYLEFLPYAHKIYLTEVDKSSECDTYFPTFNKNKYNQTIIKEIEENNTKAKIVLYELK